MHNKTTMKRILFFFALLISFSVNAQIRVCQLPSVTGGTVNDYIIKEDSSCNGTRRMKISDFISTYSLGGGAVDTSSLSDRIDSKVDTIYKNSTKDSIIYTINGRRHAISDSISGSGGAILPTITVEHSDAGTMMAGIPSYPVLGQTYKIINIPDYTDVEYILETGVEDPTTVAPSAWSKDVLVVLTDGTMIRGTYDLATNTLVAFRRWMFSITQSGTSAPVTTDIINELGEVPTWSHTGLPGQYVATTVANLFTATNVMECSGVLIENASPCILYQFHYGTANTLEFYSVKSDGTGIDDAFTGQIITLKIKI